MRTLALKEAEVAIDVLHMTPRGAAESKRWEIKDFMLMIWIQIDDKRNV